MLKTLDVISPGYRAQQEVLHADPRGYGQRGNKWTDVVLALIDSYQAASVLDYGCGQGSLIARLKLHRPAGLRYAEYDPAIEGHRQMPSFADLVVCTDVLEHVEPDRLVTVIAHLRSLARRAVFVVVSLIETAKILDDGRNAHLTIQPASWWVEQFTAAGFLMILPPPAIARQKTDKEWVGVLVP